MVYARKFYIVEAFVPDDRWGLWAATFTAVASAALLANSIGLVVQPEKKGVKRAAV